MHNDLVGHSFWSMYQLAVPKFICIFRYLFGVDGMMKLLAMYYSVLIQLISCGHNRKCAVKSLEQGMGIPLA